MPPKHHQESESDDEAPTGRMPDFSRFTNPNFSREFMATLPPKVRSRVKLLMTKDDEFVSGEAKHRIRKEELRRKFEEDVQPLFSRRKELVTGDDPTDEEIAYGFPDDHKGKVSIQSTADGKERGKGISGFWRDALSHHVIISDIVTEKDAKVLEHLIDITCATLDPTENDGFVVAFTFAPNEFMTTEQVMKTVVFKREGSQAVVDHTAETKIEWKEGKDPTVETVTKKQKSKSKKGAVRYVTTSEPCDSFFNLFKPSSESEEVEQWCSLASSIREKICPLAVEYFTGEAPDGSSDVEDDGEDEEEEDEEEEEETGAAVPAPRGKNAPRAPAGKGAKQPDCKQQ